MRDHTITTPDGRTLQVLESGDLEGRPVLMHNGTPNSRLMFGPDVERARQAGVRWISYDRPGYGGSSRHPGHTIADCVADVRTIATALGIERLAVMGHSGGGPRAVACAALMDDMVPAVAVLASPAPYGAPGLDYFAGMGDLNVEDMKLRLSDAAAADARDAAEREDFLRATPEEIAELMETLLSPVDLAAFTSELAAHMVEMTQDGLAAGPEGWCDDNRAGLADWGFEISEIRMPVLLMHGREDRFVPFGHGQWLASEIPGVEARLLEDEGHLSLLANHLAAVFDWLLERL